MKSAAPDFEAQKQDNEARVLEDELENREVPRGLPPWVGLHTTTRCNLRCTFCLQADGLMDWKNMSDAVFGNVVRELFPTARVAQLSASGEPFLTPRLRGIIDVLAWYGVKLDVVTNGTLLSGDLLQSTVDIADTFNFSVDGACKRTYEALRIGADFEKVLDNIIAWNRLRLMKPFKERPRLAFTYILTRQTIRELDALIDITHALRADEISLVHLSEHREEVRGQSLRGNPAESNHYVEQARSRAHSLGIRFSGPRPFFLTEEMRVREPAGFPPSLRIDARLYDRIHASIPEGVDPEGADIDRWWTSRLPQLANGDPRCYFLWRRAFVDPEGWVIPCCHPDAERLGNLNEATFWSIWASPRYAEYRRRVYSKCPIEICDNCFVIRQGGRVKDTIDAGMHNDPRGAVIPS